MPLWKYFIGYELVCMAITSTTILVLHLACETGMDKTAGSEGLLGLQRTFLVAGISTVLASLWSMKDTAM